MRIRIDTSRETLLNIPRGVLALVLILLGIATGYILPALFSLPMRPFVHKFAGLVIASGIVSVVAILCMRKVQEARVNMKVLTFGVIIGAFFSLFFWGAQFAKVRAYRNTKEPSQQPDRETTSETAPSAASEASHP